ncbi:MAG: alternative ribosome rescue aminoacyl-tRNA hydrolase ArfB [Hyphomonadaceae bacterium]
MISVTPAIELDESEIEERFIRAGGPGGQNVNKVSSAVELRFDARNSPALEPDVLERLTRIAGRRMTQEGVIVINAQRFRTQERNRADALERLVEMIREAAVRPVLRRPTRPTYASKVKRLDTKTKRGQLKSMRGRPSAED